MKHIFEKLNSSSSFLLSRNNGFSTGFNSRILISDSSALSIEKIKPGSSYFGLIRYDHKNSIETIFKRDKSDDTFFYETQTDITLESFDLKEPKTNSQKANPNVLSQKDYLKKAKLLKEHIQIGNIYEINYCIPFVYDNVSLDPYSVYQKLNLISLAPFSALAKIDGINIISSSPERFIRREKNKLITEPMKGTAKRSPDPDEDSLLKEQLASSLKERSENVMIVDVARNDLSRIALKGSVKAEQLYEIKSYKQVHQMISRVSCEINPSVSFNEIINATFPMASMTGAPKIRAMKIIDEVEEMPRGAYSGCIGYIDKTGDFDFSVLIRTIFYDEKNKRAWFWVGSAITAMSDPEKEYEECLLKAKALREVLES